MTNNMTAEMFALFVAGVVAPYLTQVLKKFFGDTEGITALWLSFGVSVGISVAALVLTGELGWVSMPANPTAAIGWFVKYAGVIYALSTLIYKNLIGRPE